MNEKISLKIRKLLELSKSSNEHEARNAMLRAQEMLIKYKLTMREVEGIELTTNDVEKEYTDVTFTSKRHLWKESLADVIANNFGCKMFYTFRRNSSSTRRRIVFLGRSEDANISNIVLTYAIETIDEEVKKIKYEYTKKRMSVAGLENDFAMGFVDGLRQQFEEQKAKNQEWGLVLSVPKEVEDFYQNIKFSKRKFNDIDTDIKNLKTYKKGEDEGRKFSISDKIAKTDNKDIKMITG